MSDNDEDGADEMIQTDAALTNADTLLNGVT